MSFPAWDSVVKVGAINCVRSENLATCRHYYVSGQWPWVKFFPPLSTKDDMGKYFTHELQDEMLQVIADYATEMQNKTHPPSWPNLAPYE